VKHTHFIMAHTPLAKLLRHAASTAAQSDTRNATADDSAMSRREFVRTISAATAGLALPSSLFGTTRVATSARVVVVGAGLAGLTCAYRLKRSGIIPTVYEANTRLGAVVGPDAVISRKDKLQNMGANSSIRGIQRFASSHRSSVCRWIICSQRNQTVQPPSPTSMAWPIPIAMPFVI
jgi:NAD(P)-binding Rossmann-like domain